jgi:hypothetical protein
MELDVLNTSETLNNNPENYSNFSLFGIGKPSQGQIKRRAKRTIGECIQPAVPENPLNRRKWADYRACLKAQIDAKNEEIELAKAQEREKVKSELSQENQFREGSGDVPVVDDDKILGMPKGLAIGLGIAVLAIGGFIAYKVIKK